MWKNVEPCGTNEFWLLVGVVNKEDKSVLSESIVNRSDKLAAEKLSGECETRQNLDKKRSLHTVNEHFEPQLTLDRAS